MSEKTPVPSLFTRVFGRHAFNLTDAIGMVLATVACCNGHPFWGAMLYVLFNAISEGMEASLGLKGFPAAIEDQT